MERWRNEEIRQAVSATPEKAEAAGAIECGCAAPSPMSVCGCEGNITQGNGVELVASSGDEKEAQALKSILNVELLVIDLNTCTRCVPTGDQLRAAVRLLTPVAEVLGIELRHREIVVQTPEEAKQHAFSSSPTIRLNGRDIAQDIRESLCESCGDLTLGNTPVDCREWHYRGKVYSAAPLPMLIEAIMGAMLSMETPPVVPSPLAELPENLQRYFKNKKLQLPMRCC
jgi:hypothetical protein